MASAAFCNSRWRFSSLRRFASSFSRRNWSSRSRSKRSCSNCSNSGTEMPLTGSKKSERSPSLIRCVESGYSWIPLSHRTLPALVSAINVSTTNGSSPRPKLSLSYGSRNCLAKSNNPWYEIVKTPVPKTASRGDILLEMAINGYIQSTPSTSTWTICA